MTPEQKAEQDYKATCGVMDNPYTAGTEEYERYMWRMAQLWNEQFKAEAKQ